LTERGVPETRISVEHDESARGARVVVTRAPVGEDAPQEDTTDDTAEEPADDSEEEPEAGEEEESGSDGESKDSAEPDEEAATE